MVMMIIVHDSSVLTAYKLIVNSRSVSIGAPVTMRSISLVLLLGVVAFTCGYSVSPKPAKIADKDFLLRQKSILELLQHINQYEILPELYEEAKNYNIEDHYDYYTNVAAVREFVDLYRYGLLPLKEIFSIYNESHREQAIALFHVFYYAKDWEAFYRSIQWARFHVNHGLFVYALTVSVLHRKDTVGIQLPAPYEIYPYYFFNSETIQRAHSYKMNGFYDVKKVDGVYSVYIPSNYTGQYGRYNEDQTISYFTEDIGLNAYYYYFHADYPFWMGGQEYNLYKDRRGELFLFYHQQLLARYYLERISNGLGEWLYCSFISTTFYIASDHLNNNVVTVFHSILKFPFYVVCKKIICVVERKG